MTEAVILFAIIVIPAPLVAVAFKRATRDESWRRAAYFGIVVQVLLLAAFVMAVATMLLAPDPPVVASVILGALGAITILAFARHVTSNRRR